MRTLKKLMLNRETLRSLNEVDLRLVAGGGAIAGPGGGLADQNGPRGNWGRLDQPREITSLACVTGSDCSGAGQIQATMGLQPQPHVLPTDILP